MTHDEFISKMKEKGALVWGPVNARYIEHAISSLQRIKCAMLPNFMIDLYTKTAGVNLGTGYIFGPSELPNGNNFPIPSIVQVNDEIQNIPAFRNKTLFGRNDLFWFTFDSFGTFYMQSNVTGAVLRKYDDPYRALSDCLMGGKI